jgi:hypothetical protein
MKVFSLLTGISAGPFDVCRHFHWAVPNATDGAPLVLMSGINKNY